MANRYDEAKEDIEQLNVLCAELKVVVKEIEDELESASEHKMNKQYRYYDRLANIHYHLKGYIIRHTIPESERRGSLPDAAGKHCAEAVFILMRIIANWVVS